MPRPKPAQNVNAGGGGDPVPCEEVVSLSYDKFSLTVFISCTLKLH